MINLADSLLRFWWYVFRSGCRLLRSIFPETLLILLLLAASSYGLFSAYSYWSDELWSVAASSSGFHELLRHWLLPDTHPPLYQLLLKLWIMPFGNGEIAARAFSFLCVVLALISVLIFAWWRGRGGRMVVVSVLGTNPLFAFYGQEVRSYALSLLLSVLFTGSLLLLVQWRGSRLNCAQRRVGLGLEALMALSGVLLALVHYVSLVFVLVVLVFVSCLRRGVVSRWVVIFSLLVISIWPAAHLAHHFLSGSLYQAAQRVEWISVRPGIGTVSEFLKAAVPFLGSPLDSDSAIVFRVLLLIAALGLLWFIPLPAILTKRFLSVAPRHRGLAAKEMVFIASVLTVFVAIMALIDIFRPVSLFRFYIVVLPFVAFFVGDVWGFCRVKGGAAVLKVGAVLVVVLLAQLYAQHRYLVARLGPLVDYKSVALFLRSNRLCERQACNVYGWPVDSLTSTYFGGMRLVDSGSIRLIARQQLSRPLMLFHYASEDIREVRGRVGEHVCLVAPGDRFDSFLLMPKGAEAASVRGNGQSGVITGSGLLSRCPDDA